MKHFIETDELSQYPGAILIDVTLGNDLASGYDRYLAGHLAGAFYLAMEEDLSGPVTDQSGNHPLPDRQIFQKKLQAMGANQASYFVIYDGGEGQGSARLWFLLKYFGIKQVKIIQGGRSAIEEAGLAYTQSLPKKVQPGDIQLEANQALLVDFDQVQAFSQSPGERQVLIDSRSHDRYLGLEEPLYDKAGHIPHAKSYYYGLVYDDKGYMKSQESLKNHFKDLQGKNIMVSCGSGVTACSNLLALDEIGLEGKLYPGSYSQWLKKDREVAKGNDE
ncbi:sulfurtransferase [Facklamia sp. 7083-14-GEN3]|uniref:sulfurtransferase n=1 Tax=Facklamia sp. 7083-14-GEN3 TaxID=2973478 RepID=UPI00215CC218|nr:rhodanese-like domain-containing protein [Facklamia sp. 7083-14-GEN3]MCR8968424.1 rhodanese-like domain-containing protein [Facklamia sp. 7083-14-GEN3]